MFYTIQVVSFLSYESLAIIIFMILISNFKTNKDSIMIGHILALFSEVIPSTYLISFYLPYKSVGDANMINIVSHLMFDRVNM